MSVMQPTARRSVLRALVAVVAAIGMVIATVGARPVQAQAQSAEATMVAYDGGLRNGWSDLGWGPRTLGQGAAKVDVGAWQGWILGKVGADLSSYGSLSVRIRVPAGQTPPLVLARVGAQNDENFPTFTFGPGPVDRDGWTKYSVPVSTLNPERKSFDRLLFMASREVPAGTIVELDSIVLSGRAAPVATRAAKAVSVAVDCGAGRQAISPGIYGIAFNALTEESQRSQFTIGATTRRWGGDPTSRYNWELGNAWNPGHNWYWRNLPVLSRGNAWQTFFSNNASANMTSALTIPMLGWVAKDSTSYSFPVSQRGAQTGVAPDLPDAGNGIGPGGEKLAGPPPQTTSRQSNPAWVAQWIEKINADGYAAKSPLSIVYLDNEPDLWNESHRDIRSEPSTYDEILAKGVEYASAVRAVDGDVQIAGPAAWGWWGYFYSAADARAGFSAKPDRRAHGDKPFLEWYLAEMAAAERRTGKRLLDIVDVHYYPSGAGVYSGTGGKLDQATNELRVRTTRSLWDPSYKEEGWVDSNVYLLPRLRDLVKTFKPGTGISIGEYNFGGERHMSGAVAQAEALGRFGQYGVTAAYLWTHPAQNTEQYWGFRAFRNYDGAGSNFGSIGVSSSLSGSAARDLSVFASTDPTTSRKTIVLINRSSTTPISATWSLARCGRAGSVGVWSYAGGAQGFARQPGTSSNTKTTTLKPWSIQVVRVE